MVPGFCFLRSAATVEQRHRERQKRTAEIARTMTPLSGMAEKRDISFFHGQISFYGHVRPRQKYLQESGKSTKYEQNDFSFSKRGSDGGSIDAATRSSR